MVQLKFSVKTTHLIATRQWDEGEVSDNNNPLASMSFVRYKNVFVSYHLVQLMNNNDLQSGNKTAHFRHWVNGDCRRCFLGPSLYFMMIYESSKLNMSPAWDGREGSDNKNPLASMRFF